MPDSPNPLRDLHRQADAETQNYGDIEIVTTFGQPQAEYAAIRKGVALIDLPQRTFIEVSGPDRLTFLNNLLTNQTYDKAAKQPLPAGRGVYAFLLHAKTGRIISDLNVLELGARTLLELDARVAPAVTDALSKYVFAEKVTIRPTAHELHVIAVHGPAAPALLGGTVPPAEPFSSATATLFGQQVIVYRDDSCGVPGVGLILPADAAREVWMRLLAPAAQGAARVRPIGWAAFNTARIEAGRGLFGIDFDENFLPAETGQLDRAVSFTKGCYPGQEIVARMHSRKQLARRVAGFRMTGEELPLAAAPIHDAEGNQIGAVTSSTPSPLLSDAAIGLAILKRPFFETGATFQIAAEGAMRPATVVQLPFISF